MIVVQQGRGLAEVAQDIGVDMVAASSLKAALDLNWDDPNQKNLALGIVLDALERVETFVQTLPTETEHPLLRSTLETARQIETQDVEISEHGEVKLRSGVASAFVLDWNNGTICCPNQVTLPFSLGAKIQFPQEVCATCPLRESCTSSPRGRSISIHPEEQLFRELRERQLTPIGRAKLRERVCVEHSLSHIGRWQGEQARYIGCRKNLFDLRRVAVVHNLHVLAKIFTYTTEPASTSI